MSRQPSPSRNYVSGVFFNSVRSVMVPPPGAGTDVIKNVGIKAIQLYFPRLVVNQDDLEKYDNVSSGKYTIGLGQQQMGFCADNEDIVSIATSVTESLLKEYKIDPSSIGFLAVGTETLIDKSKSVKTELMRLFGDNHDIEGVDVKNACFGGTQAFFHAVDWVVANYATEKRLAIAVLADIAVYEAGPARCTGGAGAVAVLVGPDAPLVIERGLRAFHMNPTWDFYKPICRNVSEYPIVDGPNSLQSYMSALEGCYQTYRNKAQRLHDEDVSLNSFSAAMFHSPFAKMVQKAVARLTFMDHESGANTNELLAGLGSRSEFSFDDRSIGGVLTKASQQDWARLTDPYLELNRRVGNMYTPSLFAQLVVYLAKRNFNQSDRILMFAYGSGSASAMFSLKVCDPTDVLPISDVCSTILSRLDDRLVLSPDMYSKVLSLREKMLTADVPFVPASLEIAGLSPFLNTFMLTGVDEMFRRTYTQVLPDYSNGDHQNNPAPC